jgi:hypothetical protein
MIVNLRLACLALAVRVSPDAEFATNNASELVTALAEEGVLTGEQAAACWYDLRCHSQPVDYALLRTGRTSVRVDFNGVVTTCHH